jgi:DNA repair ATPase RecN
LLRSTVADNERDKRLIDVEDSKRRIEELKREHKQGIRDNTEEIDAQQRQIKSFELAEENSRDLIAEVEGSLTALTEVTRALSEITATRESMRHNVTQAMKKFHYIADRNKQIFDRVARSWQQMQAKY